MLEILRLVREVEPPRPSTKLSTADALPTIAANRGTEPKKLTNSIRGEIDWIVMKSLEKDRTRRYETANGFALDVMRYLADEPVAAGPPSASYRLRKFVKRNRGQVTAGGLLAATLVLGTTVSTWQALRATSERNKKDIALQDAERNEKTAVAAGEAEKRANEQTQKRLKQVEKGNEILTSVFVDLDPNAEEKEGKVLRVLLGERLDQAVKDLEGEAVGDTIAVARMQSLLGRSLLELGHLDQAEVVLLKARKTLEASLGAEHVAAVDSVNNLASLYQERGRYDEAEPMFEQVLKNCRSNLGNNDLITLRSMNNLARLYQARGRYDEAETLFKQALEGLRAKLGASHRQTLNGMNNLAALYLVLRRYDDAEPLFKDAMAGYRETLGAEHPMALNSLNNLAELAQARGSYVEAESLHKQVLEASRTKLGFDHPATLVSMNNLGLFYLARGRYDEAEPQLKQVLEASRTKLGPDHPGTLLSMNSLAYLYMLNTRYNEAELLLQQTLDGRRAKLGPDHPATLLSMNNFASLYQMRGKYDKAEPVFKEVVERQRARLGKDHPDTLNSMNNLAALYWFMKKLDQSIPLLEETHKLMTKRLGPEDSKTLLTLANLGVNYRDAGRLTEAIPLLEKAHRESRRHASLRVVGPDLLEAYIRAEKSAEARAFVKENLAGARKALPPESPQLAGVLATSGFSMLRLKAWIDAEPYLRECLMLREKLGTATPPQVFPWQVANMKSMLGEALAGQKKYADAEPLLLTGYQGLKKDEKAIPPQGKDNLPNAIQRLVDLYEATAKKDKADEWRKKLEEAKASGKP